MKRVYTSLAVLVLALMARAMVPTDAKADPPAGSWGKVCCGSQCTPGDYCENNGTYACCKP